MVQHHTNTVRMLLFQIFDFPTPPQKNRLVKRLLAVFKTVRLRNRTKEQRTFLCTFVERSIASPAVWVSQSLNVTGSLCVHFHNFAGVKPGKGRNLMYLAHRNMVRSCETRQVKRNCTKLDENARSYPLHFLGGNCQHRVVFWKLNQ